MFNQWIYGYRFLEQTLIATKCHQMDGDVKLYGDVKPTSDGCKVVPPKL